MLTTQFGFNEWLNNGLWHVWFREVACLSKKIDEVEKAKDNITELWVDTPGVAGICAVFIRESKRKLS